MPEQLDRTLALSTCSVRSPEPGDYDKMADLAEQLGNPSTVQQVWIRLDAMANSNQYTVYVAQLPGGQIGGWIGLYVFRSVEQDNCAGISGLIVDEQVRYAGIYGASEASLRMVWAWGAGSSYERIIGFSLPMFEHAQEYRRVDRALLGSNAEAVVRSRIHSVLAGIVSRELILELRNRSSDSPVSPALLAYSLVSTYISVLKWWLNSKNPVSPKELDVSYRRLVLPCLASILG